jgi:hypothetical protein
MDLRAKDSPQEEKQTITEFPAEILSSGVVPPRACEIFAPGYVAFFLTSFDRVSFCGSFFMDCFSASFFRASL